MVSGLPVTGAPRAVGSLRRDYHFQLLTTSESIPIIHLKQIHAQVLRTVQEPLDKCPDTLFLYSRLIQLSALHDLAYTLLLFERIPIRNRSTFIYNNAIRAYAHSKEHKEQAFCLFRELLEQESLHPDKHTFPLVLKACAYLFSLTEGMQAHAHVVKRGFSADVFVNNSLIHFYFSCGCSESARKVFDKMSERSAVSWNVIIDAMVQMGEFEEALRMYQEMKLSFDPDGYTMQSLIDACAGLGSLSMGMWLHTFVLRNRDAFAESETLLKKSLVEMYWKCGCLEMAVQVFQGISKRDVNSWNSIILGLAAHGEAESVFRYFDRMIDQGIKPNSITFLGVLSACSHRGLVDEGRRYFNLMVNCYKIEPVLEHYGCLINLLASQGHMDEALDITSSMPIKPDAVIWRSLLNACCKQTMGLDLSQEMAKQIMAAEENPSSGVYVLLSRVYASAKRWNEVGIVRKLMTERSVDKEPGCTSVEVDGVAHEFFAGDTTHPLRTEIYLFLNEIQERLRLHGYVPDLSQAHLVDEGEEGKEDSLRLHSEKLAIAFAIMESKSNTTIRMFKNLGVCRDCHSFTKLVSEHFNVEIVMRDRLRFHHFKDGSCSCKDVW